MSAHAKSPWCRLCCAALTLGLGLACKVPDRPPPRAPERYFGVQTSVQERAEASEQANVNRATERVLTKGLTVAFFPPDHCQTTTDAPDTARPENRRILMECGALMAKLEQAAIDAGFQVASWQNLKRVDTLVRARELEIDYLFEINEFGVNDSAVARQRVTNMAFFEQTGEQSRSDVVVQDANRIGMRCLPPLQERLKIDLKDADLSATMSLKLVAVDDGRAKWFYEKTIGEEEDGVREVSLYYPATPTIHEAPRPKRHEGLVGLGLALGILGFAAAVGGAATMRSWPSGGKLLVGIGVPFAIAGGAVAGAGYGLRHRKRVDYVTEPDIVTYPRPDDVLCASAGTSQNPFARPVDPTPTAPVDRSGSGVRFEQSATPDSDPLQKRRAKLLGDLVDDLFATIDHELVVASAGGGR